MGESVALLSTDSLVGIVGGSLTILDTESSTELLPLTSSTDPVPEGVLIEKGIVKGFHIPEDEAWRLVPEFARDRDYPFFRTTVDFVLAQVKEYAKIKGDNEADSDVRKGWDKVRFDLESSELLMRLLDGKPAFVYPPPKSFKSHWYDLIENGEAIPYTVKFSKFKGSTSGTEKYQNGDVYANIDEFTWDIKQVREENEYRIQYHEDAPVFTLRKAKDKEKNRILHPRMVRNKNNQWIVIQEDE